jgi:hypothetical protein
MRVNIENMLRQIASAVHRSPYGYAFMLGELSKHLRQLRDRTEAGDSTALDGFFRLYVFDDQKEYARAGLETGPERCPDCGEGPHVDGVWHKPGCPQL